ncbi:hypothetical protein BCR43DRAFT_525652 [Syncephalastrum racemosum]|uniref:Uncharacterized protein n=1 Tax=Syncephalastrum racemosum TaxID=13706 RepID=A0A1X2H790_SYNRA|nr:hypothetical protein BCR43DRAFT_525652 [Syncephalastrum racemosum]
MDEQHRQANEALNTLAKAWGSMMTIMQAVADASDQSMRQEPKLADLQQARNDLDALFKQLKSSATALQPHSPKSLISRDADTASLEEERRLREESARVSDQIKQLLSQSYALQFQMDMLLASSHYQTIKS